MMLLSITGLLRFALIVWIIWIIFKIIRFIFKAAVVYYVTKNKLTQSQKNHSSKTKPSKLDYEGDYVEYEEIKD